MQATSRDLRTPITSVLSSADLLSEREAVRRDPESAYLVSAIQASGTLMLTAMMNVLEMRSIEASGDTQLRLILRPSSFDPAAMLRRVVHTCTTALGGGMDQVVWEAGPPLPPVVSADAERTARVVQNMVRADWRPNR